MKDFNRYILFFGLVLGSFLLVNCADDDDNNNIIEQPTCDDGIQNGDEEGIDCGGSCPPCDESTEPDFSGTFTQEDMVGRPGVNTVFSGENVTKSEFNITAITERTAFQPIFENTLEAYHDVYGDALEIEIDYETNILGWDAPTFTTVLAQFDALQVAPTGQTTYFDPGTGVLLTGRTLADDVIDISLTLMFGGKDGTRFDGSDQNGDGEPDTPQLTSDGVDSGDRDFSLPFPYLEDPKQE
ncbi:hypothetical protein [Aureitalea marina]|uniref:DUF4331 domain-containing protein n=1 Tax=Aureitalea marina TaxID=930804 RepID=A0A2S7KPX2_9FLAO|nr:hypothetical protein [Aureitalea marina]PQB04628.1 hypothetical protein BST85_06760 [Aureitalea marina]